jgi:hypothetical protein
MVNLITYGAPANGVFGIPNCEESTESFDLCELAREVISAGVYTPWLQVYVQIIDNLPVESVGTESIEIIDYDCIMH